MQADVMAARLDRVETWSGYREALRELHASCGSPKYGTLSASSGLAKSAISGLIGTNPVQRPSETNSLRFVEACLAHSHRDPASVASAVGVWRDAWRRLKAADEGMPVAEPGETEMHVVDPTAPHAAPARTSRPRRRVGVLATLLAVTAVLVGAFVWHAHPSPAQSPSGDTSLAAGSAAPGCTESETNQPDVRQRRHWDSVYVCPTSRAAVYQWASLAGAPIGLLRSNPSWIVCWTRGARVAGSDVWYYTQGDDLLGKDALDAWGFISAADVDVSQAPDPGVARRCSFPTRPGQARR